MPHHLPAIIHVEAYWMQLFAQIHIGISVVIILAFQLLLGALENKRVRLSTTNVVIYTLEF